MFSMDSARRAQDLVTSTTAHQELEAEENVDPTTASTLAVPTTVVPTSVPSDTITTDVRPVPTTVPEVTAPTLPEVTVPTLPTLPEPTVPTVTLPPTPTDSSFLDETNEVRQDPLAWSGELAAYARVHVAQMMSAGQLYHSDISRLLTHWEFVGENVGVGSSVDAIQEAYMASPTHEENITDPRFTHFGSYSANGPCPTDPLSVCIWTTEIFGA